MINIEHTLRPFQERDMNSVSDVMTNVRKTLFCAHTGYGKTYSFCTIAKWYRYNYKKKVLIICDSEELITQSMATCVKMGLTVETILSSTKRLHHKADVYISMDITLHNRLQNNNRFLLDVGLVIIDEAHGQTFLKHINFFSEQKILGFTATPVLNEKLTYWRCERCDSVTYSESNCCGREMMEWSKPKTMSLFYDDIVVGANIDELIDFGQVVKDICFVQDYADISTLKTNNNGEFSNKTLDIAFGSDDALFNAVLNYEKLALGKKTIIFNPTAKVNKLVYEQFKDKGYNIRLYDSVNDTDSNRKDTVKWFNNTEGAILCNVSCFTKGFDSTDIECVILNRSTTSLALFLQMVGRGARGSSNIYKDSFIVIDGGGNINRFGKWSDPTRDWRKIFFEGIGSDKPKKELTDSVVECRNCGELYTKNTNICPECGEAKKVVIREKIESDEILQPIDNIPLPNGNKIVNYTISKNEDVYFAFRIMTQQILDLFMYHGIIRDRYENWKGNGKLSKRLGEIIRPCYFVFISSFKGQWKRTLAQCEKKVVEKLDKYYKI